MSLTFGTLCNVAFYFAGGWGLWLWAVLGAILVDAQIPALAVYGPELFPTSLRGRANGIITDHVARRQRGGPRRGRRAGRPLRSHRPGRWRCSRSGPLLLAVLVIVAYPETAGRELEEINPEDA